jgi:hypothetical protein
MCLNLCPCCCCSWLSAALPALQELVKALARRDDIIAGRDTKIEVSTLTGLWRSNAAAYGVWDGFVPTVLHLNSRADSRLHEPMPVLIQPRVVQLIFMLTLVCAAPPAYYIVWLLLLRAASGTGMLLNPSILVFA